MAPSLARIDHIHVYVAKRSESQAWYERVFGLTKVAELEHWAGDGGPLTLADGDGRVHIALFEREPQPCRSTIALGVDGAEFIVWRAHLTAELPAPPKIEDHGLSWSLYFADPDGNPYEITTYEYAAVAAGLKAVAA